jgi:hypothetical protein
MQSTLFSTTDTCTKGLARQAKWGKHCQEASQGDPLTKIQENLETLT